MRKLFILLVFIGASAVIALTFMTSTSYTQLVLACLFYPPLAYLTFMLFPQRSKPPVQPQTGTTILQPMATKESTDILDIDKRAFLKVIGAAGLSLFLFSIFSRRGESLLFGRSGATALEDPNGNKIHPAEQLPTDGYQISEIDDNYRSYYGFINKGGAWYIMRQDPDDGSVRYVKGDINFPRNWQNREHLKYDYYNTVFS